MLKQKSSPKLFHKVLILNPQLALSRSVMKVMEQKMDVKNIRIGVPNAHQRLVNKLQSEAMFDIMEYTLEQPHTLNLLMKGIHTVFMCHNLHPMISSEVTTCASVASALFCFVWLCLYH